ncbi:2-amino-4-hydroxy-6-hydroxymethyldihydropteridine diphosphokinase [candidate division KSB1 bacterium]|nr:2-amino-4-hydroxy-6-hydroxymethyldihydropteridine diphosphokinase [candidate division KSB1 bacterium]
MRRAFIGLGSNIGDRCAHILLSITEMKKIPGVNFGRVSGLYNTESVGHVRQENFLNAVIEITISISPEKLLDELQKIEKRMGRTRGIKWGPRIIDLDILFVESVEMNGKNLVLPHKELAFRRFVLEPLYEIASDVVVNGAGQTVRQLLKKTPDKSNVELYMTSDAVLNKLNEV